MKMSSLSTRTPFIGAAGAALALALSGGVVAAQDEAHPAHPVHIHSGSCAELGDVVFPLSDISDELIVEGESAAGEQVGAAMDDGVRVSVTTVDAALSDITGAEHAVNAHLSADDMGTYIACGDVGGTLIGSSDLAFRLHEMSDSGHHGVAWLSGGDGTTTVYLFLWQEDAMMDDDSMDDDSTDDESMDDDSADESE